MLAVPGEEGGRRAELPVADQGTGSAQADHGQRRRPPVCGRGAAPTTRSARPGTARTSPPTDLRRGLPPRYPLPGASHQARGPAGSPAAVAGLLAGQDRRRPGGLEVRSRAGTRGASRGWTRISERGGGAYERYGGDPEAAPAPNLGPLHRPSVLRRPGPGGHHWHQGRPGYRRHRGRSSTTASTPIPGPVRRRQRSRRSGPAMPTPPQARPFAVGHDHGLLSRTARRA